MTSESDRKPVPRGGESKKGVYSGYSDKEMPMKGYLAILLGFAGAAVAYGVSSRRSRRPLPGDLSAKDIALMGIATHKIARIAAYDEVTSAVRAPVARCPESTGSSEVVEESRGRGLQRAVGDLVTCAWCLSPWVSGVFIVGHRFWPRQTRLVAGWFTIVSVSDFLHQGYVKAKKASKDV
ncbi:DUF1360 domain-containing protein [Pelagicoccus sp. SDUM812002]|uniref:DUF1360 domain-containing protein n=1 Tax=Pelagicoccus sp. SDUM812002 TaxID=3041266 RepID=UPI0028102065|nr:DUF1360 domain-containing protein [Pelagicoccus sp. SDUM812002]MDQ8184125.1 DUF1360 domain-containing protein [Pelagicoccus sp. SDUM812002]